MHHSLALRRLVVGTVIATAIVAANGPAATAGAPITAPVAGCAHTVELQPMQFPTSAGQRRSIAALLPDEGGALAPTATVVERRTADSDELDLVIDAGAAAVVLRLYVAPDGCVIAWSHDVHPVAAPEGRRSVRTPAFTVRLIALAAPDCAECQRPV